MPPVDSLDRPAGADPRLRRLLDALPGPMRRGYAWLRQPGHGTVRVPLALLLIGGGLLGFLPLLGFWMVPLGVLLLAEDVPALRAPCLWAVGAVQGWWDRRQGCAPMTGWAMAWASDPQNWASLLTLTLLEIVLGIDNLIFLSILAGKLPPGQQAAARRTGLVLALGMRLGLLAAISWLMGLTAPLFEAFGHGFSARDLILVGGGLFLIWKGTQEIHARIEGEGEHAGGKGGHASFAGTILQIGLLDIVFSLDSVITAVGMASHLPVMVAAVVISMAVMLFAATPVSGFVNRHPTVKMLALSFLLLIGMTLVADGFGAHVPKGYVYAAIGFSVLVEALNQLAGRRKRGAA